MNAYSITDRGEGRKRNNEIVARMRHDNWTIQGLDQFQIVKHIFEERPREKADQSADVKFRQGVQRIERSFQHQ